MTASSTSKQAGKEANAHTNQHECHTHTRGSSVVLCGENKTKYANKATKTITTKHGKALEEQSTALSVSSCAELGEHGLGRLGSNSGECIIY